MKKINWGIIGTGTIAKKFAAAVNAMPNCCLYAVGSRNIESASAFASNFKIHVSYGSYEELAADDNIDIIYIATPHAFHFENAMLCIKNKKNVLCEKPFTVNYEQANTVFKAAKENNVFIMEAFWTKFLPAYSKIDEILKSRLIGDVLSFTAQFGYTANDIARRNRKFDAYLAGGALLDIGIYTVGVAEMIMGNEICELKSTVLIEKNYGTDYLNTITIVYNNGSVSQLSSCIGANLMNEAVISGINGSIRIPKFSASQGFTVELNDGTKQSYDFPFEINGFEYQIAEAMNCVRNNMLESNIMKHSDTLSVMNILDTVRKQNNFVYPFEGSLL